MGFKSQQCEVSFLSDSEDAFWQTLTGRYSPVCQEILIPFLMKGIL